MRARRSGRSGEQERRIARRSRLRSLQRDIARVLRKSAQHSCQLSQILSISKDQDQGMEVARQIAEPQHGHYRPAQKNTVRFLASRMFWSRMISRRPILQLLSILRRVSLRLPTNKYVSYSTRF
jgi:hypothetical protein